MSVIIPVFNGAPFLDECLASVAAQEVAPDEVIVVDDGSTDASAEIARRHDGIRVVVLPENRGPAAARNAGAAVAGGDVLTFHDADDLMAPGRIAIESQVLRGHRDVDVLMGRHRPFPTDGVMLPAWERPTEAAPDELRIAVGQPTIRRGAFELIGGYDESFRVSEDIDLLYRCRDVGAVVMVIDDVTVERRIHSGSLTASAVASGLGRREQVRSISGVARRRRARELPVAAVVAVRDGAHFVADAVKSILTQTRVPAQILVVDDGSTDDTPAVLAAFGGRITVARIEPSGLARARNHALSLVAQPLVAFCDADDLWLPTKTEAQVAALEAGADTDGAPERDDLAGVFCGIEEFHDEVLLGDRRSSVRRPRVAVPARMAQTFLVRRDTFDRVGAFDPDVRGGEFIEWLARAESRGLRFGAVPEVLARRRIHGDNTTVAPGFTSDLAATLKRVMDHHRSGAPADPTNRYRLDP